MDDITFSYLFNMYLDNHARVHCERWKDSERQFRNYLQDIAHRRAGEITRFDLQRLHAELGTARGKTTANRVIQLIRTVYNKGMEWELIETNPAAKIKLFRLQSRERFLDINEIANLWTAIDMLRYETTRDFLRMCLLTGARRSNVASMRFADVNLSAQTWRIPKTKNGNSHILPLVTLALEIIKRRQEKQGNAAVWVFPSDRSATGHLTKPENAWYELLARTGLTDVRIHDLRRTLASYQAMTGANLVTIAHTLGHRELRSTSVYTRLQIETVRDAMQTAIDKMALPNF